MPRVELFRPPNGGEPLVLVQRHPDEDTKALTVQQAQELAQQELDVVRPEDCDGGNGHCLGCEISDVLEGIR